MNKLFSVVRAPGYVYFRLFMSLSLITAILIRQCSTPVLAAGTCVTSTSLSGTYTVTPCIDAPTDGATLSGTPTITASYTTTGANPGVAKFIFYLGGQYLITDYAAPYTFVLPS